MLKLGVTVDYAATTAAILTVWTVTAELTVDFDLSL